MTKKTLEFTLDNMKVTQGNYPYNSLLAIYNVAAKEASRNRTASINSEINEYAKTLSVEELVNTYLSLRQHHYSPILTRLYLHPDRDLVLFYLENIGGQEARKKFEEFAASIYN